MSALVVAKNRNTSGVILLTGAALSAAVLLAYYLICRHLSPTCAGYMAQAQRDYPQDAARIREAYAQMQARVLGGK